MVFHKRNQSPDCPTVPFQRFSRQLCYSRIGYQFALPLLGLLTTLARILLTKETEQKGCDLSFAEVSRGSSPFSLFCCVDHMA